MILIVTNRGDVHADVAASVMRRRGVDPVFVHQEDLLRTVQVTGQGGPGPFSAEVVTEDGVVDLRRARVVWWRKQFSYKPPVTLPAEIDESVVRGEMRHAMDGIWNALAADPSIYWMSKPDRIKAAGNKSAQLFRAARSGFRVPRTLVSNDPVAVKEFHDLFDGQIVYKTVSGAPLNKFDWQGTAEDGWDCAFTSIVSEAHLTELEAVRVTPCSFQELIPKQRELRVAVFEDQVFTCALFSQEDERSTTDWRHHDAVFPYAAERLPDELQDRCVQFVRSYGLNFGAFDFIVTPEGEYVFLEMNPNGQWIFAQFKVPELPMVQTLADILIRRAERG